MLCIPHFTIVVLQNCDFRELPKCTLYTTLVLKSCDVRAGAAKVYFVYVLKSCDFRAGAAKTLHPLMLKGRDRRMLVNIRVEGSKGP